MSPGTVVRRVGCGLRRAAPYTVVLLICTGLTAAATRLRFAPPGVAAYWLACGVAVAPAVRWPWRRALPAIGLSLLAGTWIGAGALAWTSVAEAAVGAAHAAAVAWGFRRVERRLLSDRRPAYRVRLAHLARFLFAITLPASLLAGLLVSLVDHAAGGAAGSAWRTCLVHAAASGLSTAMLAPLMWWDRLRALPWASAVAMGLAAAAVPGLAAHDGRLFWLAPVVVILAGYIGSTWVAVLAVACLSGATLVLQQRGALAPFDGPDGFVVWLLVVWRLLGAGLVASIWSERRGRHWRWLSGFAQVHATAEGAWRRWKGASRPDAVWWITLLERQPAETDVAGTALLPPGGSLHTRGALHRLAAASRSGDHVVGLGAHGAMVLLRLCAASAPEGSALARRQQAAAGGEFVVRSLGVVSPAVATFLVAAAAYLDGPPEGELEAAGTPLTPAGPPGRLALPA